MRAWLWPWCLLGGPFPQPPQNMREPQPSAAHASAVPDPFLMCCAVQAEFREHLLRFLVMFTAEAGFRVERCERYTAAFGKPQAQV